MQPNFFTYIDNLFFNIFSYLPNERVAKFLNRYSDFLTCKVLRGGGGWTAYPIDSNIDEWERGKHSIEFREHSFLPFEFWKVTLEITNSEHDLHLGTQNFSLTFDFYTAEEAFKAFEKINNDIEFLALNKNKKILGDTQMIEFTNNEDALLNGVSLIFGKNNFAYEKHRLIIYPEAYRIDFNNYNE